MSILQDITFQRQAALVNKETKKYSVLGFVLGEFQRAAKKKELSDLEVITELKVMINTNNEVIEMTSNPEAKKALEEENVILSSFIPVQMNYDELKQLIIDLIALDESFTQRPVLFPYLKKNYTGRYHGPDANTIFLELGYK